MEWAFSTSRADPQPFSATEQAPDSHFDAVRLLTRADSAIARSQFLPTTLDFE